MKAELKQKWIEALRSGEYVQGKHVLRDTSERFCCIGVLCDIVGPSAWKPSLCGGNFRYNDETVSLLPEVINGAVGGLHGEEYRLITLNDDGKSFSEIADYIEANIPEDVS